jgi:hypothetical protein
MSNKRQDRPTASQPLVTPAARPWRRRHCIAIALIAPKGTILSGLRENS